jgi:hypothetical protein
VFIASRVKPADLLKPILRLVATLGQKSSLKKVSRKAILDVDVPKACESILMPDAPMALRLQSNLLCAVISRDFTSLANNIQVWGLARLLSAMRLRIVGRTACAEQYESVAEGRSDCGA